MFHLHLPLLAMCKLARPPSAKVGPPDLELATDTFSEDLLLTRLDKLFLIKLVFLDDIGLLLTILAVVEINLSAFWTWA